MKFSIFKYFLVLSFFCAVPMIAQEKMTLQEVENNVDKLKKDQMRYAKDATFFENQAQRLQFIDGELPTAKKYWAMAKRNREIIDEIQKEINRQNRYKEELLKGDRSLQGE
jgi:hypothetical protein